MCYLTCLQIFLIRLNPDLSTLGDLEDEDSLLKWLTSEDTLDIPDTIEQINQKMLSKLIEKNDFVAVLFSKLHPPALVFM